MANFHNVIRRTVSGPNLGHFLKLCTVANALSEEGGSVANYKERTKEGSVAFENSLARKPKPHHISPNLYSGSADRGRDNTEEGYNNWGVVGPGAGRDGGAG